MVHFSDASQAAAAVAQWSRAEDVILVKGSRGFRLEQVSMALKERFGPVDESEAEESR
jgi:UDP-N-acetylmuramyl pentapeptide synthase